jgi:hypothetical protein
MVISYAWARKEQRLSPTAVYVDEGRVDQWKARSRFGRDWQETKEIVTSYADV